MVRRIAGFLIEVGKGKPAPSIPPTAPANGLCLISVRY
jgi:tRNA U38,U39,U40 pseudouridine synthase TruA